MISKKRAALTLSSSLLISSTSFGAALCNSATAEYELSFEGRWTNSLPRPGNAHFTTLIGATHSDPGTLFNVGVQASAGIEGVAETGATGALSSEITAGISAGTMGVQVLGTDSFISPEETNTFRFTVNSTHTLFSFATMIAPSPDWFVGIHDLDLQDGDGNWKNLIALDLNSYDAGTENGSGLSLNNSATNPQSTIQALDTAEPSGALFGGGSLARLTITRVPEPGTSMLLALAALATCQRRRK